VRRIRVHTALILRPSCVTQKCVGVDYKWYSHDKQGVSVTEKSQPDSVKPKMSGRKLRNFVNFQGASKRNRRKIRAGCLSIYERETRRSLKKTA
jgi:uncharacterized protein YcfL